MDAACSQTDSILRLAKPPVELACCICIPQQRCRTTLGLVLREKNRQQMCRAQLCSIATTSWERLQASPNVHELILPGVVLVAPSRQQGAPPLGCILRGAGHKYHC